MWTQEEINLLKQNHRKPMKDLTSIISDRTEKSILNKMNRLGLSRYNKPNFKKLLDNNHQAFYWIGFLLADGHFTTKNQLVIECKDKEQISRLAYFLEIEYQQTKAGYYRIKKQSNDLLLVKNKFDINNRKTYNPPNFNNWNFDHDLLISMFIGFIDGDGSRYKQRIKIVVHSSWLYWLDYFTDIISNKMNYDLNKTVIDNRGYSYWINHKKFIIFCKNHIQKYNLEVLDRKWV